MSTHPDRPGHDVDGVGGFKFSEFCVVTVPGVISITTDFQIFILRKPFLNHFRFVDFLVPKEGKRYLVKRFSSSKFHNMEETSQYKYC